MKSWTLRLGALCFVAALAFAPSAFADGRANAGPDVAQPPLHAAPAPQSAAPQGQTGPVDLHNGALSLNVPQGYRFYSADEARAFLARNSAPAPDGTILGMLAPARERVDQPGAWASILSYQDIGYVQSDTASGLSAPSLESDVRAARLTQNRQFEGFIAQPAFEQTTPSLAWAERTAAPGAGGRDLRYEQRKLGKSGVACLTGIGSADQMPEISAAAPDLLAMIDFAPGQHYTDFQAASDRVSNFTIPALVTGVAPIAEAATPATSGEAQTSGFAGLSGYFPWIAMGLVALAAVGYAVTRRKRRDQV